MALGYIYLAFHLASAPGAGIAAVSGVVVFGLGTGAAEEAGPCADGLTIGLGSSGVGIINGTPAGGGVGPVAIAGAEARPRAGTGG